jgi:preprotein translocase subunit SecD
LIVLAIAGLVGMLGCGDKSDPTATKTKREGRVEIVYDLDLEAAVASRAEELQRDLEAMLAASHVSASVTLPFVPTGAITVAVADHARKAEIQAALQADYDDTLEARACDPKDPVGAICMRVSPSYGAAIRRAALDAAVRTIRARLAERKIASPSVVAKGETIVVELDPEALRAQDLLVRTGKLEFKAVDEGSPYMSKLYVRVGDERGKATDPAAVAADVGAAIDVWRDDDGRMHTDYYLTARDREADVPAAEARRHGCPIAPGPNTGNVRCSLAGHAVIARYLEAVAHDDPSFLVPDDRQLAYERVAPSNDAADRRPYWRSYYLERRAELTGSSIIDATSTQDPNTDQAIVLLDFNRHGAQVFTELTTRLVGKKLAIILDGTIQSAPIINSPIRGGRASITMGGADPAAQDREARELMMVLRTGSLPAPLRELSRRSL